MKAMRGMDTSVSAEASDDGERAQLAALLAASRERWRRLDRAERARFAVFVQRIRAVLGGNPRKGTLNPDEE